MMRELFLAGLRETPDDLPTWLVFADWLDEAGDPAGSFIRLSLALAAGGAAAEDARDLLSRFEKLSLVTPPEIRELLSVYRSGLPVRFRVLSNFFIGEDPPREMFGYARTVAMGFLETGRVRPGSDLGVAIRSDSRPKALQTILWLDRALEEVIAGREPIEVGLGWLGHLNIQVGSVLTLRNAAR
jgi:uncharacterized protein (TIGR02996 family)